MKHFILCFFWLVLESRSPTTKSLTTPNLLNFGIQMIREIGTAGTVLKGKSHT